MRRGFAAASGAVLRLRTGARPQDGRSPTASRRIRGAWSRMDQARPDDLGSPRHLPCRVGLRDGRSARQRRAAARPRRSGASSAASSVTVPTSCSSPSRRPPIASASIAQVHRAVLRPRVPPGRRRRRFPRARVLAVKVVRPGVEQSILGDVGRCRARHRDACEFGAVQRFNLPALLEEFSTSLASECDLRNEARVGGPFRLRLPRRRPGDGAARGLAAHLQAGHDAWSSSMAGGSRSSTMRERQGDRRTGACDARRRGLHAQVLVSGPLPRRPAPRERLRDARRTNLLPRLRHRGPHRAVAARSDRPGACRHRLRGCRPRTALLGGTRAVCPAGQGREVREQRRHADARDAQSRRRGMSTVSRPGFSAS